MIAEGDNEKESESHKSNFVYLRDMFIFSRSLYDPAIAVTGIWGRKI